MTFRIPVILPVFLLLSACGEKEEALDCLGEAYVFSAYSEPVTDDNVDSFEARVLSLIEDSLDIGLRGGSIRWDGDRARVTLSGIESFEGCLEFQARVKAIIALQSSVANCACDFQYPIPEMIEAED